MKVRPPIDDRTWPSTAVRVEAEPKAETSEQLPEHRSIRHLLWLFFWLLLIEGALRKWVFPQWSTPLLLIRDPVVILIYLIALAQGIFPTNAFIVWGILMGIGNAIASVVSGPGNLYVTIYGLRTSFLYLPLIFIIPKVFNRDDVEKIGKWVLISAIPMALLVLIQFRASPNAWVNVGAGGEEGTQLTVGFGKIRPPGTFSFTSGLGTYISLLAAFIFSWLIKRNSTPAKVVIAAIPAAGIMLGVCGARGTLVAVVVILIGMGYVCLRRQEFFGRGIRAALVISVVFVVLQFRHEFRQGMIIYESRITTGGGVRDGLIVRALNDFVEPFRAVSETPLFGEGIGLGTTVAGGLLSGKRKFLLAEGEWSRIERESGPILGFSYLALRAALVILLVRTSNHALNDGNPLPMMLMCAAAPGVLSGQWGVTTLLGFATFGAGLCLASGISPPAALSEGPKLFRISPESVTNPNRRVRGRSIYAEKLHGR